uniref:ABC1 atypical kinase-like domain-containing protein n=1 Tax=Ananas comosus var. bracteatus TaxID=296719 RepID=A0A6V7PPV2_ANACO|nr:unnamed protein product [Ananas comosus var. bracteatus]
MEAPPQLLHCGVDPFRRSSALDLRALRGKLRPRPFLARSKGRGLGVFAIATESKPGSAGPSSRVSINGAANRFGKMSEEIKKVRKQMEEDEQLVPAVNNSETLPLVYDPDIIASYWGKRPRAVATQIVQLLSVAGGFLSYLIWDLVNKKIKELFLLKASITFITIYSHRSCGIYIVARAIELREIVTSLGPAYIKLGQALSIRPDILSPAAMTELQKLCDKVTDFGSYFILQYPLRLLWHFRCVKAVLYVILFHLVLHICIFC